MTAMSSPLARSPGEPLPAKTTLLNGVLYHYDFGTGALYGIDTDTCAVVSTCDPPGDDLAEGLTNDGTFLWKGDSTTLYKFDPATCEIVATCPNPAGDSADGLSMCGSFLIMLGYSGVIYQIDPETCEVVSSCNLNAGPAGNGIASDRSSRLFVDQPDNIDVVDLDCGVKFGFPNFLDPTPCGAANTIVGAVGVPITFPVEAIANTGASGEFVILDAASLPPGAAMTPPLPVQGQPALSTFDWTPAADQGGTWTILYTATDQLGQATDCEVTIEIPLGTKYCSANANSTGSPAEISASGSASSSAGDLTLTSAPVPNEGGIFFHGADQQSIPFGNGLRCVENQVRRGNIVIASGNSASYTYDNIGPKHDLSAWIGTTRNFQHWTRDSAGGGSLFNTSNGISINILAVI